MFLKLRAITFLVYIFDFPVSVIIILMHRTLCRAHILREQQYVPVFLFFGDFFFVFSDIQCFECEHKIFNASGDPSG